MAHSLCLQPVCDILQTQAILGLIELYIDNQIITRAVSNLGLDMCGGLKWTG